MASSGTFTSGRYGGSYGPWLTLAWTQVSQSVANNTTTLDLTLTFHWSASIQLTFRNRAGTLQGNAYTYSGTVSGNSGSRVLKTQRVTITHNSNGARSVTLSGNITNLGLTYSGIRVNTMSVSGTANLNTIPRRTTMSAFSFASPLQVSTGATINYTIDRKSIGFRHYIELKDGSHLIKKWDNVDSDGASTLTLTGTEVNSIINRMSSTTTKSLNLAMRTRSGVGGGWVDTSVNRNATVSLHSNIAPTVSAVTLSQTGNPVSTHTLQGFSKIKASFTRSAGYGASISSSSIQVRRRSGGADSQTINSNDGTTTNPVSLHGVYEARGTTRDSRGRTTNTAWATITVTAYSAPSITNFSAVRNGSTPTTVNLSRATTHTVLGTSNHLTYTIQRRQGTGAWTNVNTGATGTVTTSGATGSATSTGNSVTQSYEFRLVAIDKLGGRAESLQSISTQRVVLDIHKNEGVGIGKIHERGVLDVDGAAYFRGDLYVNGVKASNSQDLTDIVPSSQITDTFAFWQSLPQGTYAVPNTNVIPNQPSPAGIIINTSPNVTVLWYSQPIGTVFRKSGSSDGNISDWTPIDRPMSGSNSNGTWIRFNDGTQICWNNNFFQSGVKLQHNMGGGLYRAASAVWTFPQQFWAGDVVVTTSAGDWERWTTVFDITQAEVKVIEITPGTGKTTSRQRLMAVGRWKSQRDN